MKKINKFLSAKIKVRKGKINLLKLLLKKRHDFDRSIMKDFNLQIFGSKEGEE
jgi:hypothetical protein